MRSPPICRRPIGGQRSRCPDRIALVDPRKRGPSPFASYGHLKFLNRVAARRVMLPAAPRRLTLVVIGRDDLDQPGEAFEAFSGLVAQVHEHRMLPRLHGALDEPDRRAAHSSRWP